MLLYGLIDEGKVVIKKEKDFLEEERKNIKEVIEKTIITNIQEILTKTNILLKDIEKIGIAAPGTNKDGIMIKAENLGIVNFAIVDILKRELNYEEIYLRNDAKCAALCEKEYGNLQKYDDCIFLCLGTGVGGAVFMNGKLLKSKKYDGFELRTHGNTKTRKRMYMWK